MNPWAPRRWESRRARRGVGWLMLLTVLALCVVTLSRGGRAAPPSLAGPTVGELMVRSQAARQTPPDSSPTSPSSQNPPTRRHPMTIAVGDGKISIVTRPVGPAYRASPTPAASPAPEAVAASPTPAASPVPEPVAASPTPAASPAPEAVAASPTPAASPAPEPVAASPTPAASPAPEPVAASPTPSESPEPSTWSPEAGGNSSTFVHKLQQMVIMLFLIGLLAFACLKALARYLPGMSASRKRVKQLEVLERQALATGATVSLVRVGKRYLVVGQTEQNVNTLCELSADQLEPAEKATEAPPAAAPVPTLSFHGDILRHYLSIFPGFGAGRKGGV